MIRVSWPCLPVGRTVGTLLGASMMVACHVLDPDHAFEAIDLETLSVLFGVSAMVHYLEREGFFRYVAGALPGREASPRALLASIAALSSLLSALFMNDPACLFLTPLVVEIVTARGLATPARLKLSPTQTACQN